jgi:prolyl 4-hydroxylase
MAKMTQLSGSWPQWIADNLARGCTPASLVEVMVREDFDPAFALQCVYGSTMPSPAAQPPALARQPATANVGYVYDTPRLPEHVRHIQTHDRLVRVALRVAQPVLALFEDLLSPEECDELVRLSSIKLKRSTIIDPATGQEAVIADRSSDGTFFAINENPFIARLDRRIGEAMHWPVENGEGLQILHYQVGGEYKPHFDYFPPADPGSRAHLAHGGQRVSTLVIFLSDVAGGGETVFPELQLSVTPQKGAAVYFEYCNWQGQLDARTLHGGAPVTAGEKWIATKWMRQGRYA